MTYKSIDELPATIRKTVPEEGQKIYLEAYNRTWESFEENLEFGDQDREAAAHRDGWAALNQEFVHNEEKGIWYRKGEQPDEPEEDQGLVDKVKDKLL